MSSRDRPPAQPDGPELRSLLNELVRLETELWDAVEARVRADHGVALGSYEVMTVIAQRPGCRVQDITVALSITVGGVSKIIAASRPPGTAPACGSAVPPTATAYSAAGAFRRSRKCYYRPGAPG